MESPVNAPVASPVNDPLLPHSSEERIQALDVIRGFALVGIFLMNVEWFNRASGTMSQGLPTGLSGADWWASRLIYVLVQGKFWTVFSLLFGMGFAVMLARAERADRNFLRPYLRRIAALAIFGAAHHILLWSGDILFSYAVSALALLILLYGTWKFIVPALVVLIGLGFIPKWDPIWGVAATLALVSVAALFLRGEKRLTLRGYSLPVWSFVVLILGTLGALLATVLWLLPHGPREPRIPVTILSTVILAIGCLSAKFQAPPEFRTRHLGIVMYLFPFVMMTAFGAVQYFAPSPAPAVQNAPVTTAQPAQAGTKTPRKTEAEKKAEQLAERAKRIEKQKEEIRTETRILSQGTYLEALKFRGREFARNAPNEAGFAIVAMGMFLLGVWFVRSGVMADPRAHLPLFRKLAWIALPVGIGLGLAGSAIATSHVPGNDRDGWQVVSGLMMLGNLPASLGYVGLVVMLLQSETVLSKISILAPAGRMALTNYLTQSTISALFFFGHGFGHWGLGRGLQVVYVAVVFALQVAFSHWWLGRFRYGPMEWLWRALTYWQFPPMRLEAAGPAVDLKPLEASNP